MIYNGKKLAEGCRLDVQKRRHIAFFAASPPAFFLAKENEMHTVDESKRQ